MSKRVAVIGAGIAGLTTAYYLAKEGYSVYVYEQEKYAGMRTSFANGGQISVSNSEVWTTWSNIKKGFKWIIKKDAPLLIRPRIDIAQWKWILKFLWYTLKGDYKKNTEWTIKTGIQSRILYDQIINEEQIEFDASKCGILHFYKSQEYWNNAVNVKSLYEQNGLDWNLLTPKETMGLDPTLSGLKGLTGGAWTESDWTGDIHKFCYELSNVLESKYNVQFSYNDKITKGQDTEYLDDCFDAIVVAAGIGSVELAKKLANDNLPIYPVKGYSITINNVAAEVLPKVSLLDDQAKIVTSTLGSRFRVAGTAELAGENYDIRRDRIQPLLDWVHTNFPDMNTHDYSQWACLRPMTPNMMPILEQSKKNPKVFYHTGHGHLGWTLSPATAKIIVEKVKGFL